MSFDHPKFSDFYSWAQQLDPTRKKRKTPAAPPPASPPPHTSYTRRALDRNRSDIRSYVIQVLAGVTLIAITMMLAINRSDGAPPSTSPGSMHPWNEDMTITRAH